MVTTTAYNNGNNCPSEPIIDCAPRAGARTRGSWCVEARGRLQAGRGVQRVLCFISIFFF